MYKEIKGDLIEISLEGKFDAIVHGCNCFCTMGAGIAVAMKNTFKCNEFDLEQSKYKGKINKLGCIDYRKFYVSTMSVIPENYTGMITQELKLPLIVINAYTQYYYGKNHLDGVNCPIDYEALTLCMRKINHTFKGKKIGLPKIGAGLAGGNWNKIKEIIQVELKDCDVTVVIYDK